MLKLIRRLVGLLMVFIIIASIVLLMNFTAPNPTGRRYSSEIVDIINNSNQERGTEGERILGLDLNAVNNNLAGQCICNGSANSKSTPKCTVCRVTIDMTTLTRIPDFITDGYIAEAKNRLSWFSQNRTQREQITDYASAAKTLGVPLWVYVRVNTIVDEGMYDIVRSTGGDIVHYFAVEGYQDPVNIIAVVALVIAGLGVVFILWREFRERRHMSRIYSEVPDDEPESPTNRSYPMPYRDEEDPYPIYEVTERKLDEAEEFMERVNGKVNGQVRISVDFEDAEDDDE